jgi:hypothetical protein
MENLRIGLFAKLALNSPELQELSGGAVDRLVKIRAHADLKGADWDNFHQYAESRIRKSTKLVCCSGPLGRGNRLTDILAGVLDNKFIEVDLDSLLVPLRRRLLGDFDDPSDVDLLIGESDLSDVYLRARAKVVTELIVRWRTRLVVSYLGADLIDFRHALASTDNCMLIWVPTPQQLLEHAMLTFKWWCTANEDNFQEKFGLVLVQTIRSWIYYFERMDGFYGRNAFAIQISETEDKMGLHPLSLDSFRSAIMQCLTPEAYASLVVPDNGSNSMFRRHVIQLEEGVYNGK